MGVTIWVQCIVKVVVMRPGWEGHPFVVSGGAFLTTRLPLLRPRGCRHRRWRPRIVLSDVEMLRRRIDRKGRALWWAQR